MRQPPGLPINSNDFAEINRQIVRFGAKTLRRRPGSSDLRDETYTFQGLSIDPRGDSRRAHQLEAADVTLEVAEFQGSARGCRIPA